MLKSSQRSTCIVGSKKPISLAQASGLIASIAAAAASCFIASWATVGASSASIFSVSRIDMQAGIEAELAARTTSDLIIGSEVGLAGAELELGLTANSSDLNDLEDLLDSALERGLELTAASATPSLTAFWAVRAAFFAFSACANEQ